METMISKKRCLTLFFAYFFVLMTFGLSAVWGTDCSPKYSPSGQIKKIDVKDLTLNIITEDPRDDKKKYFFLWSMGWKSWDPDATKFNGNQKLFLTSKPKDIVQGALSDSFLNAGYEVSDQAEGIKLRFKLEKFLYTVDTLKYGMIVFAEITLKVSVEKNEQSCFAKDFYGRSDKPFDAFRQVEDAEPVLSQCLSKIAEEAAMDGELKLAIFKACGIASAFKESPALPAQSSMPSAASPRQLQQESSNKPAGMVFVSINDPCFAGQMSKYETTNADYCEFLNAALASGDIAVDGSDVAGASGSNSGEDYAGKLYYDGDGAGYSFDGAANGGAARIKYSGGVFKVDSGFENHPVTYVSWYGAAAFCNYYGYRLPGRWEWQAVADYDGSYTYGCGTGINNSIANYKNSSHPNGTAAVGDFGTYGYGICDMSGNVCEWTGKVVSGQDVVYPVILGGSWTDEVKDCTVSQWFGMGFQRPPTYSSGFRVCR
jgi:formylglycine-generating enzyme required for sulfatase activity